MHRLGRVHRNGGMKKKKEKCFIYTNNLNFELAFSIILPLAINNSFGTPLVVTLQIFLEKYGDILKSIGKVVEKF